MRKGTINTSLQFQWEFESPYQSDVEPQVTHLKIHVSCAVLVHRGQKPAQEMFLVAVQTSASESDYQSFIKVFAKLAKETENRDSNGT